MFKIPKKDEIMAQMVKQMSSHNINILAGSALGTLLEAAAEVITWDVTYAFEFYREVNIQRARETTKKWEFFLDDGGEWNFYISLGKENEMAHIQIGDDLWDQLKEQFSQYIDKIALED